MDAADAMRFGKDVFHQVSCVTNPRGFDWLKRMFAALGIRFHAMYFDSPPSDSGKPDNFHPWHIDVNFVPLRPGLCIYNPDWAPTDERVFELFKINDWELIPAARPTRVHKNDVYLTGLYEGKSWISMNTFSFDEKTVFVEAGETAYSEQLDKLGFDVVPDPVREGHPVRWSAPLHDARRLPRERVRGLLPEAGQGVLAARPPQGGDGTRGAPQGALSAFRRTSPASAPGGGRAHVLGRDRHGGRGPVPQAASTDA